VPHISPSATGGSQKRRHRRKIPGDGTAKEVHGLSPSKPFQPSRPTHRPIRIRQLRQLGAPTNSSRKISPPVRAFENDSRTNSTPFFSAPRRSPRPHQIQEPAADILPRHALPKLDLFVKRPPHRTPPPALHPSPAISPPTHSASIVLSAEKPPEGLYVGMGGFFKKRHAPTKSPFRETSTPQGVERIIPPRLRLRPKNQTSLQTSLHVPNKIQRP